MEDDEKLVPRDYVVESIKAEIELSSPSRRQRIFEAIALAALGSIPWVGGVIAAASAAAGKYRDGEAAVEKEGLLREWLQQHQEKLQKLRATLEEMITRVEGFGGEVEKRAGSGGNTLWAKEAFGNVILIVWWLQSVVQGHFNYYAVPGNLASLGTIGAAGTTT